jgi:hypothetical protein
MATKVIRVASHELGRNSLLSDGFALGTLPGGGYGVRWRGTQGEGGDMKYWFPWEPGGLGATMYWFPWGPPQDPVRIEFEGQEFIFCRDTDSQAEVTRARRVEYERLQEGR